MVLSFVTFFNERLDTERHRYERLLGFRFCFYDILTDILFYFYRLVCFFVKYFLGPLLNIFWAHFVNYGPSIREILHCQKV